MELFLWPTYNIILLKSDPQTTDPNPAKCQRSLNYMSTHDFCNPPQIVRDKHKLELRTNIFVHILEL